MASVSITSSGTSTIVHGVMDERFEQPVWHFRGIQYGRIERRLAEAEYMELGTDQVDATKFG